MYIQCDIMNLLIFKLNNMSNTVQLRVDAKTKKKVASIFANLGLDLSTGVKIYFQQVLKCKGIPFPLLTDNGFTPEQERKILRESEQTRKFYELGKRHEHTSVASLLKELMA
ncbi:MAG: Toxin-antitoxin system, antitoxin component, ribbon-helix-helix fold protein [Candidatus Magasanikbacteria bacterium GW2011_GWC2_37_14]|uniref:Toxin-antitoxin system, antitoxin component, ribbon-helix-helix fold protein n=1 Tax=Candidatus Magasanikbacteria bacterium GW2011_GWC2_37_14 TaxID=1619046 RepID=A0A0G0JI65_9BACT|nr:MAG: Toxin-antitoxin system, antitoxin component, ribbon-helix-helix fold protein [Candidatus Magasanikbacteria bacterium GW2011_GWC2_37_14]